MSLVTSSPFSCPLPSEPDSWVTLRFAVVGCPQPHLRLLLNLSVIRHPRLPSSVSTSCADQAFSGMTLHRYFPPLFWIIRLCSAEESLLTASCLLHIMSLATQTVGQSSNDFWPSVERGIHTHRQDMGSTAPLLSL